MSAKPYWPLAMSNFTLKDRLKVARWLVSQDRFTMGEKVAEFEREMSKLSGMRAVAVANGSAANHMVFELWRLKHPGIKPVVIVPAVTWISSVTPALMAGFDIRFCDVNKEDFSFDYNELQQLLYVYREHSRKVVIFASALMGYVPDMTKLHGLAKEYGADLYLDSCENTCSSYRHASTGILNGAAVAYDTYERSILSSCEITTTSCYFSHQLCAIEFGFIFVRSEEDYENALMLRNHGLTRSLPKESKRRASLEFHHWQVDPQFLFGLGGTNWRPTEIHAVFGLLDLARLQKTQAHRQALFNHFDLCHTGAGYYRPKRQEEHSAWVLPIFTTCPNPHLLKEDLNKMGIETRPIIGGNLLFQPPFTHLRNDFKTAGWIQEHGFYVGLHNGVTLQMVEELATWLGNRHNKYFDKTPRKKSTDCTIPYHAPTN